MKITKIDVMLFHPIESSNARGKTGAPVIPRGTPLAAVSTRMKAFMVTERPRWPMAPAATARSA